MELIQPYITLALQAVIGILTSLVLAGLLTLRKKADDFLSSRATASQREALYRIANEAQALIEKTFQEANGMQKLHAAEAYVAARLKEAGIQLSMMEIQAAIEKAVQDFNTSVKPKGSDANERV
ncbi:phage holin [Paenibacillus agricola]|uniref:Phage holin n=1 Tax=Paenibacillus agricola TaxID=2716264 RepID=A0ABX0J174_9BACL|nr:phage holin [Paenibacillus agricola]NHN29433.1 phage holin [Paenibacillus agricola]